MFVDRWVGVLRMEGIVGRRRLGRWLGVSLMAFGVLPAAAAADIAVTYSPASPMAGQPVQLTADADNNDVQPFNIDVFVRPSSAPCADVPGGESAAGSTHVISATLAAGYRNTFTGSFTPAAAGTYTICGYETYQSYPGQPYSISSSTGSMTVNSTSPPPPAGGSRCVVPKLLGMRLAAAKTALKAAHCATGEIRSRKTTRGSRGRVISQSPRQGTTHPAGTTVKLVTGK